MKNEDTDTVLRKGSLVAYGSRLQFGIAVAMISVIPLLVVSYLLMNQEVFQSLPPSLLALVIVLLLALMVMGYDLIIKYPKTIIRLRNHIEGVAKGELLDKVDLYYEESDITAIQKYVNLIVTQMKERIKVIQRHEEDAVALAQERVMVESFCTACHHLAQPATVLISYLEFLKDENLSDTGQSNLAEATESAEKIADLLRKLNDVSSCTYCNPSKATVSSGINIIDIENHKAA